MGRFDRPDLRDSIRGEIVATKRQIAHYARLTTSLELQLETIDRQTKQCIRRGQELAENLELEEYRLATAENPSPAAQRRRAREAVAV